MNDLFAPVVPVPTALALLDLAIDMRRAQMAFYANKDRPNAASRELLKEAKRAEAKFDRAAILYMAAEEK